MAFLRHVSETQALQSTRELRVVRIAGLPNCAVAHQVVEVEVAGFDITRLLDERREDGSMDVLLAPQRIRNVDHRGVVLERDFVSSGRFCLPEGCRLKSKLKKTNQGKEGTNSAQSLGMHIIKDTCFFVQREKLAYRGALLFWI